jgi:Bacterial Ig domain
MIRRRAVMVGGIGAAAGVAIAACGSSDDAKPQTAWSEGGTDEPAAAESSPASQVDLTITPAASVKNVSPRERVVVTVTGGTLQKVTVTAGGKAVAGSLDTDQTTWRSTGNLSYGKTYAVAVTAVDSNGVATQKTSSFSTVKPSSTAAVT